MTCLMFGSAESSIKWFSAVFYSTNENTREPELRPAGVRLSIQQMDRSPIRVYSSIASTSATNRWLSLARNVLITLKTESLKPPMFIMSARSHA